VAPTISRWARLGWLVGVFGLSLTPTAGAPEQYRLPNGARLIVEPVPHAPLVALEVWIRAGTANETPETSGVAHLLEHMIFKGTATLPPGALDEAFENAGGILDAFTERDWTRLCATVLPDRWQTPLRALLHSVLHPALPETELEKERALILRDEYATHHVDPVRSARYALFRRAFEGHPYSLPLLGEPTVLARLSRADIEQFHRSHYRPERMVVVAVGAVEPQTVRRVVEEAFEGAPQASGTHATPTPAPNAPRLVVAPHGDCMAIGIHTPPTRAAETWAAAEVLRIALAEPYRGLLYAGDAPLPFGKLRSEYLPRLQGSLIALYALPPAEPTEAWHTKLQTRLERTLQEIASGKARHALEQARLVAVERHNALTRQIAERARWYGLCATLQLDLVPEAFTTILQQLPLEQVEALASYALGAPVPASAPTPTINSTSALRSAPRPTSEQVRAARQRLANGLRVVALSDPDAEYAVIQVAIGHPTAQFDPATGELTARMLFGSTHNETERTLAARIARSGGSLQVHWTPAGALITALARRDSVISVLSLLKEALFRAEFTEQARLRALRDALYDRRYSEDGGTWRFHAEFTRLHADELALQRVALPSIRAYYQQSYRPENVVVVVAGNARVETLVEHVRTVFGGAWEGQSRHAAPTPLAARLDFAVAAAQGIAYTGYLWQFAPKESDYHALRLWQFVLGEGKRARLFIASREQLGRGYEVRAQTAMRDGVLTGWGWIQTGNPPALLPVIQQTFTQPLQPEEFQRARALLYGEWYRLRQNLIELSVTLAWAELSGLGYETILHTPAYLEQLRLETVEQVRQRLLRGSSVQLE